MKTPIILALLLTLGINATAQHSALAKIQKFTVKVDNGFTPAAISAKVGIPVEITFDTKHRGCATSVVFKELKITKTLTNGTKTLVKFTPKKKGKLTFACPMNMYKGVITVK